jgi:hypothetical protein
MNSLARNEIPVKDQKMAKSIFTAILCGHRIRLMSRRPGFESRQGIRFWGKTMLLCILDLKCRLNKNKGFKHIFSKILN